MSPEIQEYTLPPSHERTDDTDSTATNSSDEFDWSEDEEAKVDKAELLVRTKRGRRLWLAFVKLARPVRVVLVSLVGVAISITPLLVVDLRFPHNAARTQVHVWSLWLTIIWAASCITYLVVDLIPRFVITVTWFCGGKTERLKFQVEVFPYLKPRISKVLTDCRPVDNGRHALAEITARYRMGIDCIICPSSCVYSPRNILDNHQPCDAGAFACTLLTSFTFLKFPSKGPFGCSYHCLRGEIVFELCGYKLSPESACRSSGGKQTWVKGIGLSF